MTKELVEEEEGCFRGLRRTFALKPTEDEDELNEGPLEKGGAVTCNEPIALRGWLEGAGARGGGTRGAGPEPTPRFPIGVEASTGAEKGEVPFLATTSSSSLKAKSTWGCPTRSAEAAGAVEGNFWPYLHKM